MVGCLVPYDPLAAAGPGGQGLRALIKYMETQTLQMDGYPEEKRGYLRGGLLLELPRSLSLPVQSISCKLSGTKDKSRVVASQREPLVLLCTG